MEVNHSQPVLLVGNGKMAEAYANVLKALDIPFVVCGRNQKHIDEFSLKHNAHNTLPLSKVTAEELLKFRFSIIATAMETLAGITEEFLHRGAKKILVEKPAALTLEQANNLAKQSKEKNAIVRIALNRRFYSSVGMLKQILTKEKSVCAFFDFTDDSASIAEAIFHADAKKRWALANSVHVIDTVSYLLGRSTDIHAQYFGKNELYWHANAATFMGTALFGNTPTTYVTSWVCPGRWNIEIMTNQGRYKLSPMEKLQVMMPGQYQWVDVDIDNELDLQFKPGVYRMVQSFDALTSKTENQSFLDYSEYTETIKMISSIAGY